MNACVDNYNVAAVEHGEDAKRKKRIKPPKSQVMQVLKAAFQQFPRLGTFKEQNGEVLFKGWPTSVRGQTLFHNELMRCCRVSLRQVSQKRAHFHEGRPTPIQPKAKSVAQAPAESRLPRGDLADGPGAVDGALLAARSGLRPSAGAGSQRRPAHAPSTPPGGVNALEF